LVEVAITEGKVRSLAIERFQYFGATVIKKPTTTIPDVIVTDAPAPPTGAKRPKVVSLEQVPCVFWSQKKLESVMQPIRPMVIVADIAHKHRPLFMVMAVIPQLHLGVVPRGYFQTPFAPISESPQRQTGPNNRQERQLINGSPPDGSFCKICLISFTNASEHHKSKAHQRHVNSSELFQKLDSLIVKIAAECPLA
jgi:hypothetical protein